MFFNNKKYKLAAIKINDSLFQSTISGRDVWQKQQTSFETPAPGVT